MIKIYEMETIDDLPEELCPPEEDLDQGFTTANPVMILQAINSLAPGEYITIQNISPAKSTLTEYRFRKESYHAPYASVKASLRRDRGR